MKTPVGVLVILCTLLSPGLVLVSPVSADDTSPPTLVKATGTAGTRILTVVFSERLGAGAETAANFHVYLTDDSSTTVPGAPTWIRDAEVILGMADRLGGYTSYTVEVSGVEDLAGNVIAPGSTVSFTTGELDVTPPVLLSASGMADGNQVTVNFSEPVPGGDTQASNYRVYPSGDPDSPLTVYGAIRYYGVVTLTLTTKLAGNTAYTVEVSNLTDLAENVIAPNSTAGFTTGPAAPRDVTPPSILSVTGAAAADEVHLVYSEWMGIGATNLHRYHVYPSSDPSSPLTINSAQGYLDHLTLTLASNLLPQTAYTVAVESVEDLAGNVIAPNTTAGFSTGPGDVTPPELVRASGTALSNTVTASFSEPVGAGAADPANYRVYPTAEPSTDLGVSSVTAAGSSAILTVGTALVGTTSYTVEVSGVADLAGNPIAAHSTAAFTTGVAIGSRGNQQAAVVALHAQAHASKTLDCGGLDPSLPCGRFTTTWPVDSAADVYMVVALADPVYGVSGVSLGIRYATEGTLADGAGCDVLGYTACSDLEYTNSPDGNPAHEFPYSGGGNRFIWVRTDNCRRTEVPPYGVQAVACVFYVYAYGPDLFSVDMNRNLATGAEFQVVDCPGPSISDLEWPSHAGVIGFGQEGYNPCVASLPVVNTTWGRLKNQYQ